MENMRFSSSSFNYGKSKFNDIIDKEDDEKFSHSKVVNEESTLILKIINH